MTPGMLKKLFGICSMQERDLGSAIVAPYKDIQELTTSHNRRDISVGCPFSKVRDQDGSGSYSLEARPGGKLGFLTLREPMPNFY